MFLANIAPTIISDMTKMIDHPISITDEKGYIVGATDDRRIRTLHKPSLDIIAKNDTVSFDSEQVTHLENVLPGVAAPILFHKRPIGVLGIIGRPEEVGPFIQPVKNYIELYCLDTLNLDLNKLENRSVSTLVKYLIHPDLSGRLDHVAQLADLLGFDLSMNRVCFLYWIEETADSLRTHRSNPGEDNRIQTVFSHHVDRLKYYCTDDRQDIFSILNPHQFIVLKTIHKNEEMPALLERFKKKTADLARYFNDKYRLKVTVSVGSPQHSDHLDVSYQHAVNTVNVGKCAERTSHFLYYDDLDVNIRSLMMNLTLYEKERLHAAFHRFFGDSHFDILAQTFTTYCQCSMNLSETSRKLFLHRNSLVYRLNKIARLTSLDVSNFEHCFYLYFAIKNFRNRTRASLIKPD